MRRYTDWLIRTTMKSGADIRLEFEATPSAVMAEDPDAIVIATARCRPGLRYPDWTTRTFSTYWTLIPEE
jgi:hypothetical protein